MEISGIKGTSGDVHENMREQAQENKEVQHAPGMCMKTKETMTICLVKYRSFTRIRTNFTVVERSAALRGRGRTYFAIKRA
jgi:hypothetical protein